MSIIYVLCFVLVANPNKKKKGHYATTVPHITTLDPFHDSQVRSNAPICVHNQSYLVLWSHFPIYLFTEHPKFPRLLFCLTVCFLGSISWFTDYLYTLEFCNSRLGKGIEQRKVGNIRNFLRQHCKQRVKILGEKSDWLNLIKGFLRVP